jgi:preprotein translocase subunit SecE
MGSKATLVNGEERQTKPARRDPGAGDNFLARVTGAWDGAFRFLSDVRAEMRKVVSPTRKEVETTTVVVIFAVFIFGLFFFLVDAVFSNVMNQLILKLVNR